jgi:transposase
MTTYMPFDRDQRFLLPPDVKDWLPADDVAHFIVAAVERVRLGAFHTNARPSGKPQYHPRLMLALLVYSYANGVFASRRIERATYRDVGTRFIAANTHPDHDTIASFRRTNQQAFEAAFLQVLLLAREMGLLRCRLTAPRSTPMLRRSALCVTTGRGRCAPSSLPTRGAGAGRGRTAGIRDQKGDLRGQERPPRSAAQTARCDPAARSADQAKMAKLVTENVNRPSSRSLASSRARSDLPAFACAASKTSPPSGC